MPEIILAESAGYCFGVNKAVESALSAKDKYPGLKIYTLGYLIHNLYVVDMLKEKGVEVANDLSEVEEGSVIIIRSHGVGKEVYDKIYKKKLILIDATCPHVKSLQNKVEKYYKMGYNIIIVGDENHPEVIGVNGWCEDSATIIYSIEEAEKIESDKKICVVAQTTIMKDLFNSIAEDIKSRYEDTVVLNTICNATEIRQTEAKKIASEVECMVVVGDHHSSNTGKLVEICKNGCKNVFHVETKDDVDTFAMKYFNRIGVTAGASTPDRLIKEVIHTMENAMENFEKNIEESIKAIGVGDIIEGEIIGVTHNEVTMSIGYKSDGIVKKADFLYDLYDDLTTKAALGDKIKVMVLAMNDGTGNVSLSKLKVDELAALEEAEKKFNAGEVVEGKITKIVKGGVIVDLGFIKAFMPASNCDIKFIKDLNTLLGNEVKARIVDFDKAKNKIILSRRVLLEEARDAKRAAALEKKQNAVADLEVGQIVKGEIRNITNFGLFMDLNGVDGFVHISDIAWKRVNDINKLYKVGDEIEAKIVELDKEAFKIKLTIKGMTKEPWAEFIETYKVGDVAEVTVKNVANFGAFAEILPEVEGLIHVSQLSHEKVTKVSDVVKTGDKIKVKITGIDNDKRKISLSLKEMTAAPKKKIEKNKVYYKENESFTLGDMFGDLLKNIEE